MAGISGNRQLVSGSIQYCISVGVQVFSFILMDRYRRRWALMTGSALLATFLFTAAGLMATYGRPYPGGLNNVKSVTWVVENSGASKAIIACAYLFVASYALTWGYVHPAVLQRNSTNVSPSPIGWLYPAEVLPLYIRSKATSIGVGVNWVGNFALTFFTPPAFQHIQWRVSPLLVCYRKTPANMF